MNYVSYVQMSPLGEFLSFHNKGDFFNPWMPKIALLTSTSWANNTSPKIVFTTDFAVALRQGRLQPQRPMGLLSNSQASLENNRASSTLTHRRQYKKKSFCLTDRNNRWKLHHFDNHRLEGKLNVQDLI